MKTILHQLFGWMKRSLAMPTFGPIAGGDNDYSSLSADTSTYIALKTLMVSDRILRMYNLADKATLPENNSTTFQYTRYERIPLPQTALSDGTTPTSQNLTVTVVTATAVQWGTVATITDVAQMSIKHKPLQKAIELLGLNAGETIEREIFKVVAAGTSVYYPGTVASRITLGSGDVVTADTIRRATAILRANGAYGLDAPAGGAEDPELGDLYVGVCDSYVEADVTSDDDFIKANQYAKAKRLWNGEIGEAFGIRWVRSNSLPTLTSQAAAATSDNTADNGTITAAYYVRVMVTGIDTTFGYESLIFQSSGQQAANDANNAHTFSVVVPTVTGYGTFNIYASPAQVGATSTSTAMYLATSSPVAAGTYKVGSSVGSASSTRLVLPTSANAAAPAQLSASTAKVHQSFVIGKEAFTCVNLQNLTSTLTPPVASDSDPLQQRRKCGWKAMFKSVICNNNFFLRVESESAFD